MKRKIKLFDPYFDDSEKNAILKTLNSHFWASGNGVGNVKKHCSENMLKLITV